MNLFDAVDDGLNDAPNRGEIDIVYRRYIYLGSFTNVD